jgi:hypothetical protein
MFVGISTFGWLGIYWFCVWTCLMMDAIVGFLFERRIDFSLLCDLYVWIITLYPVLLLLLLRERRRRRRRRRRRS